MSAPLAATQSFSPSRRVLVIDDDRDFADSLRNVLVLEGYDVETAQSATSARHALDRFDADVALIDIRLGESNGIELISELHQRHPKTLCVMISAYTSAGTAIDALHHGADAYLNKPFHDSELLGTLDRCFGQINLAREKREAERALRASEERYRSLFDHVPVSIREEDWSDVKAMYDDLCASAGGNLEAQLRDDPGLAQRLSQGAKLNKLNDATVAMYRAPNEEALVKGSLSHEDDGAAFFTALSAFANGSTRSSAEGWKTACDGSAIFVRDTVVLPPESRADWRRVLRVAEDLTERKRADDALQLAQQKLEKRVEERTSELAKAQRLAKIGNWRWSIVRDELVSCSEEYARIHGVRPDEIHALMKHQMERVVHPEDRDRVSEAFARFDKQGLNYDVEYRVTLPEGEIRHVHEIGEVIFDTSGEPSEHVGTVQDVTERKSAEEALLAAMRDADRANHAKSDFLARMSHELRTPLNGVLGFAQLLENDFDPPLDDRRRDFVNHITSAGHHLLELVEEILDLAKIESGRTQLFIESVNPNTVLEECADLMQSMMEERSISFDRQVTEAGAAIRADGTRLKQVVLNLLSNATKYNRIGGQVAIRGGPVGTDRYRISVVDTGPGIPPERMQELFKPFSRLGAEQGQVEGTGIGLAISLKLVELMGGQIGVDSEVGEGSTFWFELPLSEERVTTQAAPVSLGSSSPEPAAAHRYTVLYIEDESMNLRLMKEILKRRPGARMLDAPNAELGLELARTQHPDVILMDINLPGMNGFAALNALRSEPSTRDVPVIAVSADAMPKQISEAMLAGFLDYVTKPIAIQRLDEVLDRALAKIDF